MTDYDSPWKEALDKYFPAFLEFFFPRAHREIAWEVGYEFLDKELQKVVRDAEVGRRLADKLVKVHRSDGEEVWVLIHIEIQGDFEAGFAERMYCYHYRLHDRYRKPLASFVVLADDRPEWRPDTYHAALWECELTLRYPVIKLRDYWSRAAELEASSNPFAVMTEAHLKARESGADVDRRYGWKLRLIKSLYRRGQSRQDILELFRFIDWMMELPAEWEERLWSELKTYEEGEKMPYVTSVERIGIRKGEEIGIRKGEEIGIRKGEELGVKKGIPQGEALILRRLLSGRFGPLPAWAETKLSLASAELLELWADRILDAASLDAVFREG